VVQGLVVVLLKHFAPKFVHLLPNLQHSRGTSRARP
jgi:hypothetical protein